MARRRVAVPPTSSSGVHILKFNLMASTAGWTRSKSVTQTPQVMEFPHVHHNGKDRLRIIHLFFSAHGFICTDDRRSGRGKSTDQLHLPAASKCRSTE